MENEILDRIEKVEKKYKKLKIKFIGFSIICFISFFGFAFTQIEKFDIIRAKGIIIEDENGRERILIGSPIPYSKDRVRTDTALVRKYWASKFKNPNQYMEWYSKYQNTAEGIVFMNKGGFDVVQIGDRLSDANVGERLFRFNGILWNTQTGWERGGAGINTTSDGNSRPVIGLDDESGEAMHMIALEDGSKAFVIGDENGSLRIGMATKDGELFQNKGLFTGIRYFDNQGKLIWEQKMNAKSVVKNKQKK